MTTRAKDLTGLVFGRLTYLRREGDKWRASCSCGKQCLVGAGSKSCGCWTKEKKTARNRSNPEPQPKYDCAALLTALGY